MTSMISLDDTFGTMPSDHFLVEQWDANSPLVHKEQERHLVRTWIGLGRRGRHTYHKRCEEVWQIPVPEHIPSDLCAFEKRLSIDPERWDHAWAMWIRTWYGNKSATQNTTVTDPASTAQADEAYARLWQRAFHPTEKNGEYDDNIVGPYIFDDSAAAYGVVSKDVDDDIELMDAISLFTLNALMRCPDVMEGCSQSSPWDYWLCQTEEELDSEQALLVLVADGEACEDGWVLMVALNHKGQVLHMRRRCKAYDTALRVTFWRDGGEPLDLGDCTDEVDYLDGNESGNGWDDDAPRMC